VCNVFVKNTNRTMTNNFSMNTTMELITPPRPLSSTILSGSDRTALEPSLSKAGSSIVLTVFSTTTVGLGLMLFLVQLIFGN
jgi:hypothetical protein